MATVIKSFPESDASRSALIGELLLDAGKLNEHDVSRVVMTQRTEGLRFGEAALRLGLVQLEDIQHALAQQFNYPYVKAGESDLDPSLAAAYDPFGVHAEALRSLRAQLMLRWFTEKDKMLAVVAPRAGVGCSRVAANLAISFSQLGERTLLIDANLRAPRQHDLFALDPHIGLSNLLAGRGSLKNALAAVEGLPYLSVLCAGVPTPNPQELLTRVTFAYLMETLPASFDVVIVDTPPLLEYADAQLIAARAGGCMLTTQRHKTRVADVEGAKTRIESSGAMLLGALIND